MKLSGVFCVFFEIIILQSTPSWSTLSRQLDKTVAIGIHASGDSSSRGIHSRTGLTHSGTKMLVQL